MIIQSMFSLVALAKLLNVLGFFSDFVSLTNANLLIILKTFSLQLYWDNC